MPSSCAGVPHLSNVDDTKRAAASLASKVHQVAKEPTVKPKPVTVTSVPPAAGPLLGLTSLMNGPSIYRKKTLLATKSTPLLLTVTFTYSISCPGAQHRIFVDDCTDPFTTSLPNLHTTVSTRRNPCPVTVTRLPLVEEPKDGNKVSSRSGS